MKKTKILLLGATGSIGTSSLEIIKNHADQFILTGVSAHTNATALEKIIHDFPTAKSFLSLDKSADDFISFIKNNEADIVINGIAGASGLIPSFATIEAGKKLALANKETIVMAGRLIKECAINNDAMLLPVDSEHSAIFSLINNFGKNVIAELILTASGGPFRNYTKEELECIKPIDALKHPTWNMGTKITIDSASLANKGLELIEACILFDTNPNDIKVVVHLESIVHSLIRTHDGVLYAQLSKPDMKHPIYNALTWPEIKNNFFTPLTFDKPFLLHFEPPKMDTFKMLQIAYTVAKYKGAYPIVYNAVNEIAVSAFINNQIPFLFIPDLTSYVLEGDWALEPKSLEEILDIDNRARKIAIDKIKGSF